MMKNNERGKVDSIAITQHEIFMSYVRAGFTDDQAMQLLTTHITAQYMMGRND